MHAGTSLDHPDGLRKAACGYVVSPGECSGEPSDVDCIPCLRQIAEMAVYPVAADEWHELLRKYRLALAIVSSTDFRHAIESNTRKLRHKLGVPDWDGRI